uniref:Uncharacterized protein n=1 Tax=Trypanosoma brucei brucei (strain 927/4 GUTat10.1) TaxID=185431 RepID=Q4FKR3_TRYB2|nr:hypothetical protein Tb09.v4.0153 [Trypanosoma brucei brucei TREU927]
MKECGPTVAEQQKMVTRYEFIGVLFDHDKQTVLLNAKTIRRIRESAPLEIATIKQMESVVSRMIYAAGVTGEAFFSYYIFFKMMRQRLSLLNRKLVHHSDRVFLPKSVLKLAKQWMSELLKNVAVAPPQVHPSTATLATDATVQGWGWMLFRDTGEILIAGGAWEKAPHMISQGEARAIQLSLLAFRGRFSGPLHICVDNTTVMHIIKETHIQVP